MDWVVSERSAKKNIWWKAKVKLSLRLSKYHTMKTHGGMDVQFHTF